MNIDPDLLSGDLSSAMGTEALLAHDLVPEGLPVSSKEPAERQQIRHIGGVRYLAVGQTANRRQGSKISKIWLYRRKEEDTVTDEFRRHSIVKSTHLYSLAGNFLIWQVSTPCRPVGGTGLE